MPPWQREPAELLVTFKVLVIQVLNCPGIQGMSYLERVQWWGEHVVLSITMCVGLPLRPSPGLGACNILEVEDWGMWLSGIFGWLKGDGSWWCCGCFHFTCNREVHNERELVLAITLFKRLRKAFPRKELLPLGIYIKSGHPAP